MGDMDCFLSDVAERGFRPRSILDVGANEGVWTRRASAVFPGASFLLIEPQHEMNASLEAVARDLTNVRFIQAGAGAQKGVLTLTVSVDLQGSSFLAAEDAASTNMERRPVPIITIDSLYEDGGDFRTWSNSISRGSSSKLFEGRRRSSDGPNCSSSKSRFTSLCPIVRSCPR
jgi:FkbM family methyltransferase